MQRKKLKDNIRKNDRERFTKLKQELKIQIQELQKYGYDTQDIKMPRFTKDTTKSVDRVKSKLQEITDLVSDIKNREDNDTEIYSDYWYAISNFRAELTQSYAVNFPFVNYLLKWASDIILEFGERKFGEMLLQGQENGYILTRDVMYNENNAGTDYMNGMLNFLAKDEPIKKQELYDKWEETEDTTWIDILRNLDY